MVWIRTQNKRALLNCNDLFIDKKNYKHFDTGEIESKYVITESGKVIGTYSTEEKAMKVLDEIENQLTGLNGRYIAEKMWQNSDSNYVHQINVYQMPEDEKI